MTNRFPGPRIVSVSAPSLFEEQAGRSPDSIAVAFPSMKGDVNLTYSELNRRANQLARHLRSLRSLARSSDPVVGIYMDRSPETIIGLLGILKAGFAYLPLDVLYPRDRIQFMLADSKARAVLTRQALSRDLPLSKWFGPARINIDQDWRKISAQDGGDLGISIPEKSLAYLLYTSGSTGRPKGVAMEHAPLANLIQWHLQFRATQPAARTLAWCSISFDFSFHEIFSTLCSGGSLIIAPDEIRTVPPALIDLIRERAVERLFMPVAALNQLAEASESADAFAVREVFTTGEQLKITPTIERFFRRTGAVLHNHYGATEFQDATTLTLRGDPADWPKAPPIGQPISNVQVHVFNAELKPASAGEIGELFISGAGLARGYLNNPTLTQERFLSDPSVAGRRLYRTGDLARLNADGSIEHLGRKDQQIKIRGFRIEIGEIEAQILNFPGVQECAVIADKEASGKERLIAFLKTSKAFDHNSEQKIRGALREIFPEYMIPHVFIAVSKMPLTPSGKLDRGALAVPEHLPRIEPEPAGMPKSEIERVLSSVWRSVLNINSVGVDDNFFDLGGTSILLTRVHNRLVEIFGKTFPATALFNHPTIRTQTKLFEGADLPARAAPRVASENAGRESGGGAPANDIAIIGMACRFPGANSPEEFWRNLKEGIESISFFTDDELANVSPTLLADRNYIKAGAVISDVDCFDAAFFGYSPQEASVMDPQQRILLECAWEALESSGVNPWEYPGIIGVYATSGISTYLINRVAPEYGISPDAPLIENDANQLLIKMGNDRNYLSTRISYKLNLKGPSVNIQTACSSGLVAVHLACMSIRAGECEMALAGGVSIVVPQERGYLFESGMIRSPDGHCRAFDARGQGTLFGNGAGAVVLKSLSAAMRDGDPVLAVIKSSAINNDGATKVGYSAPSETGQAAAIASALSRGNIDPATIGYVEAHGTGTVMGDPVELAALARAYDESAQSAKLKRQSCPIGSVKTNIGHLDEAAGLAGLIKTVLALKHGFIPPSLHFETPNPHIDFENSPFYVNTKLLEWKTEAAPRRAGVSSFGVGGVNAHVVLEEAPRIPDRSPEHAGDQKRAGAFAFVFSAMDGARLRRYAEIYLEFLERNSPDLRDLAFTLQNGRKAMPERLAIVAASLSELVEKLGAFVGGKQNERNVWSGNIKEPRYISPEMLEGESGGAFYESVVATADFPGICRFWVSGVDIEWSRLNQRSAGRRIPLPTYPFAKERFWIGGDAQTGKGATTRAAHPLLHGSFQSAEGQVYATTITGEEFFIADHRVEGTRTLPGVVYLEMALAAVHNWTGVKVTNIVLSNVVWLQPFSVEASPRTINLRLRRENEGKIDFVIYFEDAAYCQGAALLGESRAEVPALDIPALKAQLENHSFSVEECYASYRESGMIYGPGFRALEALYAEPGRVLAKLSAPGTQFSAGANFTLNPILADGALQAPIGLTLCTGETTTLDLPFALEELQVFSRTRKTMWVLVECSEARSSQQGVRKFDVTLCDELGNVCMRMKKFSPRVFQAKPASSPESAPARPVPAASGVAVIRSRLLQRMSEILKVEVAKIDPERHFAEYGFNSISLTLYANQLNQAHGLGLSPALLFEYSTVAQLAEYLATHHPAAFLNGRPVQVDVSGAVAFREAAVSRAPAPIVSRPIPSPIPDRAAFPLPNGNATANASASAEEGVIGVIRARLLERMAALLKIDMRNIDPDRRFAEYGFDSISLTLYANQLNQAHGLGLSPALLFEYSTVSRFAEYLAANYASAFLNGPSAAPAEEDAVGVIRSRLLRRMSDLLKVEMRNIDPERHFAEYGFNSISLTLYANQLNQAHGLGISPALLFEHSTVARLAEYLAANHAAAFVDRPAERKLEPQQSVDVVAQPAMAVSPAEREENFGSEPVAIIGVSGRFPMARDVNELWSNLVAGKDCITEIPPGRWDWRDFFGDPTAEENKTNIKWGGFIEGVDEFDPAFFSISREEAEIMDPHQRLLLLHAWKAIEDAGYSSRSLAGGNTAVIVGTGGSEYSDLLMRAGVPIQAHTSIGVTPAFGPNRVSYFLDVHGPSEPVDTTCSSSLVAIHRAVSLIQSGECEMAIAGGVSLMLTPDNFIGFSKAGLLSPDGRCHTFSEKANGYVRSEGVGVLVLKRLKAALESGDHIYGVIRSSAVNHGGRATSISAPNPRAQKELLKTAYRKAKISPATISYMEAHGTGTALGDPIEIHALKAAFQEMDAGSNFSKSGCAIGSIKSNIGHAELASGVAGVIKVLLQFKHKRIIRNLHCEKVSPYINFADSPFYIADSNSDWKPLTDRLGNDLPRRAGVSSFGFGGANAHVVLEEFNGADDSTGESASDPTKQGPFIFTLSAKTKEALLRYAADFKEFIEINSVPLLEMTYTLQVGRDPLEERLACVVNSPEELLGKLAAFLRGDEHIENAAYGKVVRNHSLADHAARDAIARSIQARDFSHIIQAWVSGAEVDWRSLYAGARPRRVSLPTYPFARERYWVPGSPEKKG